MKDLFKSKAFWSMIMAAVCTPLLAFLNGSMDGKAALISGISGVISGVLGVLAPQPQKPAQPAPDA